MEACHMSPGLCVPRYELLGPGEVSAGKPWGGCAGAAALEPPQLALSNAIARSKNAEHKRSPVGTSWVLMPHPSGLFCFSINKPSTSRMKYGFENPSHCTTRVMEVVCWVAPADPITDTAYDPDGVPVAVLAAWVVPVLLPPPQATCDIRPPISKTERQRLNKYLRLGTNNRIVPTSVGASIKPIAYSQDVRDFSLKGRIPELAGAAVAIVNVEV